MENPKYANAYKEVLVVINNLVKEDYEKIPKEYIEFLEANCNKDYNFEYDNSKPFAQQNLLDDTKYVLFALFEKFGATNLQKEKIKSYVTNYNRNPENQNRKIYEDKEIKQNHSSVQTQNIQEEKQMVKHTNKKWYQRLILKIRELFKRN